MSGRIGAPIGNDNAKGRRGSKGGYKKRTHVVNALFPVVGGVITAATRSPSMYKSAGLFTGTLGAVKGGYAGYVLGSKVGGIKGAVVGGAAGAAAGIATHAIGRGVGHLIKGMNSPKRSSNNYSKKRKK